MIDSLPPKYEENIPQDETEFLYIPIHIKAMKCKIITKSDSIYLIKTARNEFKHRFIIRRLYSNNKNYLFFIGTDSKGNVKGCKA